MLYTVSMTSEIRVDETKYVTSKVAAMEVGYSQDYVGQLARAGEVLAERSGGLWYVNLESLRAHKAHSGEPSKKPLREAHRGSRNESVVTFDAKEYISSKRASEITGYSQDYVTQLARSGKILARSISNRWYVYKDELISHKKHNDALLASVQADAVGLKKNEIQQGPQYQQGPELKYYSDSKELLPSIAPKVAALEDEKPDSTSGSSSAHNIPIHVAQSKQKKDFQSSRISEHILDLDEILKDDAEEKKGKTLLLPAIATAMLLFVILVGGATLLISSESTFTRVEGLDEYTSNTKQTALAVFGVIEGRIKNFVPFREVHYHR